MTAAGEDYPARMISDDPAFAVPGGIPGPAPDIAGDLEFLEYHWGSAYSVAAKDGAYTADRRDGRGSTFTAPDRDGLIRKIEADYAADPVSRNRARDLIRARAADL